MVRRSEIDRHVLAYSCSEGAEVVLFSGPENRTIVTLLCDTVFASEAGERWPFFSATPASPLKAPRTRGHMFEKFPAPLHILFSPLKKRAASSGLACRMHPVAVLAQAYSAKVIEGSLLSMTRGLFPWPSSRVVAEEGPVAASHGPLHLASTPLLMSMPWAIQVE